MFSNSEPLSGLSHALDVMEALAEARQPLRLSEVAIKLGMSKAGTHRILSTLAGRGYAERLQGGMYQLGIRAWEVGCAVPQLGIVQAAIPAMQRLSDATQCSVLLISLSGFSSINLHSIVSEQIVRVHVELGSRFPANCTAGGLACLAALSDEALKQIMPGKLPKSSEESISDPAALLKEIAAIRKRGYSINLGGWRADVAGVGVAVAGRSGEAAVALNVAAPRYQFSDATIDRVAAAAQKAAAEVSVALANQRM